MKKIEAAIEELIDQNSLSACVQSKVCSACYNANLTSHALAFIHEQLSACIWRFFSVHPDKA